MKSKKDEEKKEKGRGRDFRANAAQGTLIFMGFHILRETRGGGSSFFSCPEAPIRDVLFRFS